MPLVALAAIAWTAAAAAQQSGGSAIVNQDVLESLSADDPAPADETSALLPAPEERPRSTLLVPRPKRATPAPQPAAAPAPELETPSPAASATTATPEAAADSSDFLESPSLSELEALQPAAPAAGESTAATAANDDEIPAAPEIPLPPSAGDAQAAVTSDAKEPAVESLEPTAAAETPEPSPQTAATTEAVVALAEPKTLLFAAGSDSLNEQSKDDLTALAPGLVANPEQRLQLQAYADGALGRSQARRLSLSRALAVRSFLIKQGVASQQIDVRALGDKNDGGALDRVDIVYAGG